MTLSLNELFAQAYEWQEAGEFHKAGHAYAEYLNQRRGDPSAWNNLGNCYRSLGRDDKAIPCFDEALKLEPGRASSRLNRGLALLATGDYLAAWPDYEARLETIEFRKEVVAQRDRQWHGEHLGKGEPLYLFSNQGLGDAFQTWRFLPEVEDRVEEIVLELQEPILPLAGGLSEKFRVVKRGDPVGPVARWCELFSLPGLLDITRENLPQTPRVEFSRSEEIQNRIRQERERFPGKPLIGFVWSGTPANPLNRFRACGLNHLRPFLEREEFRCVSLQKDAPATEIETLGLQDSILDLGPFLTDFGATATAIEELDLVIATDTSIPNLIGMLNREAWVMLHRPADWRWGQEGERSPWYPSLRLFRQKRMRDWPSLIDEVLQALLQRLG